MTQIKKNKEKRKSLSTCTSEAINSNDSSSAPIAELTQTTDDKAVSSHGVGLHRESYPNPGVNSGLTVAPFVSVAVKQVDYKTITGSNPGDHRAPSKDTVKASMDSIANPPGPRDPVRQFQSSRYETDAPVSGTNPNAEVGD